jgi:hypothetical protein
MGLPCIGRRLKLFDKKTAQALLTALVFALALMFLYFAWRAIITFLFAIFFAYILEAPVSRLQGWLKGSRPAAIAVVYLIFIGALIIAFVLVGPPVMEEAQKLTQQAPELGQKISSGSLVKQLGEKHGWNRATVDWITDYLNLHQGELIAATQNLVLRAVKTVQGMWWLPLVPICTVTLEMNRCRWPRRRCLPRLPVRARRHAGRGENAPSLRGPERPRARSTPKSASSHRALSTCIRMSRAASKRSPAATTMSWTA